MKIYNFKEISSTNDFARELLKENEIVCVTAMHQTKGRGRNNNTWYSNFGNNLNLSFGISHSETCTLVKLANFQSIGSLAVKHVLEEYTGKSIFRLKYPNDVYAFDGTDYKKLSGILVEHGFMGSECTYSIIGIGVNVLEQNFPVEISQKATSLKLLGFDCGVDLFQNLLIDKFSLLLEKSESVIFELWQKELNIIGKEIKIIQSQNQATDYDSKDIFIAKKLKSDGRLVVINHQGKEIIIDNGDSIRYNLD